jgi:hypothetical protein
MLLIDYAWNEVDKNREREELKGVDARLEAWGVWARSSGVNIDTSRAYIVTEPDPDDVDVYERETTIVIIDSECEEIDKILARMAIRGGEFRYWKLAHIEYRTYGTIEIRARRARLSVHDYRYRLKHLQLLVQRELARAHEIC